MQHWFSTTLYLVLLIIVIISCFFTCRLALQRLKQRSTLRQLAVVTANLLASVSLLALLLGVSYETKQAKHVVLLTNDTTTLSIEAFQNSNDSAHWIALGAQLNAHDLAQKAEFPSSTIYISSMAQLPLYVSDISQITILGKGLSKTDWLTLNAQFNPLAQSQKPIISTEIYKPQLGLIDMTWPERLVVAQFGEISGRIQTPNDSPSSLYRLSLSDPFKQELASVLLSANEAFTFPFSAKVPGQWFYTLTLTERGNPNIKIEERVAIQITEAAPANLIIKQSAPSFESRHLQSLVSEAGGKVLSLSKISKNKEISQNINLSTNEKEILKTAFTAQGLGFFDLLIIDALSLSQLNDEESQALEAAIKNGLGVLVQVQSQQVSQWQSNKVPWLRGIDLLANDDQSLQAQYLRWDEQQLDVPLDSIKADIVAPNARRIVSSQNNRALVVQQEYGRGKVAVSLINTTYTLKTQGKADLHSHYWQWLFSQVSRSSQGLQWQQSTIDAPLMIGQTSQACALNASELTQFDLSYAAINNTLVPIQSIFDAAAMCVAFTPQTNAWYYLSAKDPNGEAVINARYAYKPSNWQAWQQSIQYHLAQQNTALYPSKQNNELKRTEFISPIVFWSMLLLALTLLWIERKQFA